ncbi:MAG: hypothetical protein JWR20_1596, partial [Marmoricola sp.]|nr:hypothetical protein [Marmoricola sp.]
MTSAAPAATPLLRASHVKKHFPVSSNRLLGGGKDS